MNDIKKRWMAVAVTVTLTGLASADVMLPKIMGSGMVLQRGGRLPSGAGRIRAKR